MQEVCRQATADLKSNSITQSHGWALLQLLEKQLLCRAAAAAYSVSTNCLLCAQYQPIDAKPTVAHCSAAGYPPMYMSQASESGWWPLGEKNSTMPDYCQSS